MKYIIIPILKLIWFFIILFIMIINFGAWLLSNVWSIIWRLDLQKTTSWERWSTTNDTDVFDEKPYWYTCSGKTPIETFIMMYKFESPVRFRSTKELL
jgi:hypothetical protein